MATRAAPTPPPTYEYTRIVLEGSERDTASAEILCATHKPS